MMMLDYKQYDLVLADDPEEPDHPSAAVVYMAGNFRGRSVIERSSILCPTGGAPSWATANFSDEYKDATIIFGKGGSEFSEIRSDLGITRAVFFVAVCALVVDPNLRVAVAEKSAGYIADVTLEDMRHKKTAFKTQEDFRSVHVDAKFGLSNRIVISLFDASVYDENYVRQHITKAGVHLFEFSDEVLEMLKSLSTDDVRATIEGLRDADLLRLPYDDVAIRTRVLREGAYVTFHVRGPLEVKIDSDAEDFNGVGVIGTVVPPVFIEQPHQPLWIKNNDHGIPSITSLCLTYFMIAMATRNTVKRDRLANQKPRVVRGLKAGHRGTTYLSRTIIELPPKDSIPYKAGGSPRLHLRRGHAHTVRFGRLWSERRVDWFPPILVNCDDGSGGNAAPRAYKLT